MIDISKDEAKYLASKGRQVDIHSSSRTHGAKKISYFITTSPKTMKLLLDYRKKHTISSHEWNAARRGE